MFYNHELLKRSGRFGVLWLAATKPKLLTESEYRQCDLKALCEEIREFIQYRARREQGKPLFSLRTCTTLVSGATVVFIQQTKSMVRDCRRFSEKIYRLNLGFDSQGNCLNITIESQSQHLDLPQLPEPFTSEEADGGRKTPKTGKGAHGKKGLGGDDEEEGEEDDDKNGGKGTKRKKEKDEGTPKKKRKGKTTLTDPDLGSTPRCWDSAFDNILRGIPETEESDFFDPGAFCVADTSRITIREFVPHQQPVVTEMDDAAADRYEQMMAGERPEEDALMEEDLPLPQDLDVPDPGGQADVAAIDPPLQGEEIAAAAAAASQSHARNVADSGPLQGENISAGNLTDATTASTSLAGNVSDADPLQREDIVVGNLSNVAAAADADPLQGEDILAGNLFDTAAGNVTDAPLRSGISLLRDGMSHQAMHSTRVEHSDLQLSSDNQDAVSQTVIAEIPAEQLMRGIIPEVDYSQDFFDPSANGEINEAAAPQADISLQQRSIPAEEGLPSTSVGGTADEAHLSVNNLRRSQRLSSSSQQSIRIAAEEPLLDLPQGAPIGTPQDAPMEDPQIGLDHPHPAVEEAAPLPPTGAADPAPEEAAVAAAEPNAAAPQPIEYAPPAAPAPQRRCPPRPKPFRDVEIAIDREIVKRRIRKEQENEGLEGIPVSLSYHLMERPKPDMEVVLRNPGWMKDVGSKIKPFFQENLVTKQRGNAEGIEDEDEDEREREALDRELTREGESPSMVSRGNSTLFNRSGRDPSISAVEHSRRGERSLSQSQQILHRPSIGETSVTRQPDEQIPVANLPAVQEEIVAADTAGVEGPPARDDVESVATVLTTDTAPSTTSSIVPTVTVTEPSPPDDVPPGTVPGCVKFPDKPKEKSTPAENEKEKLGLSDEGFAQNVAPTEPLVAPGTPPAVFDIPMAEVPEQDPPEILSNPVPGASNFDENPPEPHESVPPAPPSPVAAPFEDAVADIPSDVVVNPSFRRLPTFQELCPSTWSSRKRAIDVFNGVLRAALKQLVHAIQDGRTFGGEIELFCRGVDSQHGADCFCRDRAADVEFVYQQFLSCLEPIVSAPTI